MQKRFIINFLFVISFPVYGIGNYIAAASSPSLGYMVSLSVYAVIILFHCVDLIYKREFRIRFNTVYTLMLMFILSTAGSLFVALQNGLPETNFRLMLLRSLLLFLPFHAFIVLVLYNEKHAENLPRLTLLGLSSLVFVNLAGFFGLGLTNATHTIEGRLSFPFIDSFYSGAGVLAIINLMLLFYFKKVRSNAVWLTGMAAYFVINLVMFYLINSRLAIMIFVLLVLLWGFGMIRVRGLYLLSVFTIPILLSSGLILYKLFQLPAVSSILQRVDIDDVTTFHGRSYIWQDGIDWLLYDQRGLFFGNGYKGHYFLDLIYDVVKKWNAEAGYFLHLHSTSLEILVCQGIVAFAIFSYLFHRVYTFYMEQHREAREPGAFFPVVLFLLFILQVDTFVYLDGIGFVVLSLLVAHISINKTKDSGKLAQNQGTAAWKKPGYYPREAPVQLTESRQAS